MSNILVKTVRRVLAILDANKDKYQQSMREYIEKQELPITKQRATQRRKLTKAFDRLKA